MARKDDFRDHVREFGHRLLGGASFDKQSDIKKSEIMTRCFVEEIVQVEHPGLLPDDERDLDRCFVDGASDLGIDFVCREGDRVLIIQAKYHGQGKTEKIETLERFRTVLTRVRSAVGSPLRNRRLQEAIADVDVDRDTFLLYLLVLGRTPAEAEKPTFATVEPIPGVPDLEERTTLQVLDETALNKELRSALSVGETVQQPVSVRFSASSGETAFLKYEVSKGRLAYVGRISAVQLSEIFKQHRERIFSENIREYVGDSKTNRDIRQTAVQRPQEFFFFNNGISAVATRIEEKPDANSLLCTNLSIVNGAQTVRSLAKAALDAPNAVRDAEVLMRVTKVSLAPGTEEEFLDNVARFNNTQNLVKVSDFRSTDAVQRSLKRRFRDLPKRDGKEFHYRNKRGERQKNRYNEIGMEEFAKTLFAYRYGPADMHGGTGYLFDIGEGQGYRKLFGDGNETWTEVPEPDFRVMAGTWFLCEQARDMLDSIKSEIIRLKKTAPTKPSAGGDDVGPPIDPESLVANALERRWLVFFGLGELIRARARIDGRDEAEILRGLARPKWTEGESKELTIVRSLTLRTCRLLVKLYESAALAGGQFKHRNWFRDKRNLDRIRSEAEDVAGDLPAGL